MSQADLEQGRIIVLIFPVLVVLAIVPLPIPRFSTTITFSMRILNILAVFMNVVGLMIVPMYVVVIFVNVVGPMIVPVYVVGFVRIASSVLVLVLIPRLAGFFMVIPRLVTVLVFVVRMVIVTMRIVVVVVVVPVSMISPGVFDVNSMSMSLDVLDGHSDRSLKPRQRLLLHIVQGGSIQNTEGGDKIGGRPESRVEGRNLADHREDISQRPFLDRTGLVAEGQDTKSRNTRNIGSDIPDSITDGGLKLRDDLFLKVGQRSSRVRPDSDVREEIRQRGDVTQTREATKRRKGVRNLTVLKRPRRKWRKGMVGRKVCNDAFSSIVKRVVELIKDHLLSVRDIIGDGVHADSVEEVRNRSKDISKRGSIVERLDVNNLVPSGI